VSWFSLLYYLTQPHTVKFLKKHSEKKDVEATLQRLDRLTEDEARATAAQTLEVVHVLVQNMKAVMNGIKTRPSMNALSDEHLSREHGIHGQCPGSPRYSLLVASS
jgi:hypothetical protein